MRELPCGRRRLHRCIALLGAMGEALQSLWSRLTFDNSSMTFEGRVMGTYYAITLGSRRPGCDPQALHASAGDQLTRVELLMSTCLTHSDVARFNAAGPNVWIDVSPDTMDCLRIAREVVEASGGLFDITTGPLVDLWGFTPGHRWAGVPGEARITEARSRVGIEKLEFRDEPPAIRKTVAGVCIDLASVAKGYAVDLACAALEARGVRNYCVDVGGEIRTSGRNPRGQAWQIAVEAPSACGDAVQRTLRLHDAAVATSGDYRIYGEQGGVHYPHIIDPRTGRPVSHNIASVTVLNASCARADAWATALMVAGPKTGYDLAVQNDVAALFILRGEAGFTEVATPAFAEFQSSARTRRGKTGRASDPSTPDTPT